MEKNTPGGEGFFKSAPYELEAQKRNPWEIQTPQDDRVPGPDAPRGFDIGDLTPDEGFAIIRGLIDHRWDKVHDIGTPLYNEIPGQMPPPRVPPREGIETRPRPLVTPGEGIDSTRGVLGDLRASVHREVRETGSIEA